MEIGYLVDFDGVILDSQERFKNVMKDNTNLYDWMEYLASIEWYSFLRECAEIDESLTVLKKLEYLQRLKGIITAIHSFKEGEEKLIFLREKSIYVPIIYTLPHQKKSDVYMPDECTVLIDDKLKNCVEWELAGGKSLLFDRNSTEEERGKIRTLKKLL